MAAAPEVIAASITAILLVVAWRVVLVRSSLDLLREELFALRSDLFCIVVDDRIRPSTPAYWRVRRILNGCLWHAEETSLLFWFSIYLSVRSLPPPEDGTVEEVLRTADEPVREQIEGILHAAVRAQIRHMFRTSLLPWILSAVALVAVVPVVLTLGQARQLAAKLSTKLNKLSDGLSSDAELLESTV